MLQHATSVTQAGGMTDTELFLTDEIRRLDLAVTLLARKLDAAVARLDAYDAFVHDPRWRREDE